jgi:hypothetical protein
MVAAGFNMVFVGIESPVKASLQETNKSQNLKTDPLESVKKIIRKGIEVSAGFIIGFDSDPEDIADLQIEFIQKSAIPMAMVGLLTALPNTRLSKRLEDEGRLLQESSGNNTFELGMNFVPKMPLDHLVESYGKVVRRIYDPSFYFKRSSDFLDSSPNKFPYSVGTAKISHILAYAHAFIRSLFLQTFSSYGLHYLRFLARTLIKTPKQFVRAVKLSVMGYHFIRLTRETVLDKVKKIDSFGLLLERINTRMRERLLGFRSLKTKKLIGEIHSFRKNTLAVLRRDYSGIVGVSNEKIRMLLSNLEKTAKSYFEKLAVLMMRLTDRKELRIADRKIGKLRVFQEKLYRRTLREPAETGNEVADITIEVLRNIEDAILLLVVKSERILKMKLAPARI